MGQPVEIYRRKMTDAPTNRKNSPTITVQAAMLPSGLASINIPTANFTAASPAQQPHGWPDARRRSASLRRSAPKATAHTPSTTAMNISESVRLSRNTSPTATFTKPCSLRMPGMYSGKKLFARNLKPPRTGPAPGLQRRCKEAVSSPPGPARPAPSAPARTAARRPPAAAISYA